MSGLSIADIVDKLRSAKTKTERVEILKTNDSSALRGILRMNFDDELTLDLPDGTPPFKKLDVPPGMGNTTLKASVTGWYVFSKTLSPTLKQSKRENIFISLLESLEPREAEILIRAKDKLLDLGLTKKVIDEVFPGLIKSNGTKNVNKKDTTKTTSSSSTTKSVG